MAEPGKKAGREPESYEPRKPEIVSMAQAAQDAKMSIIEESPSFRIAQLPEFEIFGMEGIVTPKGKKGSLRSGGDLWYKLHLSHADGDPNSPYEKLFRDAGDIPAWMPPEMCRIHAAGRYRDTGADSFPYMLFAFAVPGGKTEGYTAARFPAGTWAMFSGLDMQGKEPGDVIHALRGRFAEWLPGSDYERAQDAEFEMYGWKNDNVFTDLWFPVREKQPESYQPRKPEIVNMIEQQRLRPQETLIETFDVNGVSAEVVEWRETIWCGKLAYGRKNGSEPNNVDKLLKSYVKLDNPTLTRSPTEPDWSVCMSLNYLSERPRGILFGMQVDTEQQPKVYDIYKVPPARFMRVLICEETARALGVEMWHGGIPPYEWIGERIAPQCGYRYGSDALPVFEYYGFYDPETNRHKFCYLYVPVEKVDQPESYQPKKPEIVNLAQQAQSQTKDMKKPPSRYILQPKGNIAQYSGDKWPFSNVFSAMLQAAGLLYGRTDRHDDAEYSIQNALTGEAFGLFYTPDAAWPRGLGLEVYGLECARLKAPAYAPAEMRRLVQSHVAGGNAVFLRKQTAARGYLVFGYRRGGKRLLCCEFEDGNDWRNCAYDFAKPVVLKNWTSGVTEILLFGSGGETSRETAYRQALAAGCRLMTLQFPDADMDIENLSGAGQPLFGEWARQLERDSAENKAEFFSGPPVFPCFIALYENRLHLWKFLKICAQMYGGAHLARAAELCGQLKDLAAQAAAQTNEGSWEHDDMPETAGWDQYLLAKDTTPNERRGALLEKLKACRALELAAAEHIRLFLGGDAT